jgi:hypothetical protein
MNRILEKFGIDETFTQPVRRAKKFTSVYDNVPHVPYYNYMMELPRTKQGNEYLLCCVDLGTNLFDMEPIKNKEAQTVLTAFKKMFKRKYIKKPYASVQTDGGKEFLGVFKDYLYSESVLHKVAVKDRHAQQSCVENLNLNVGRILNGYMSKIEEETEKPYREWTDIIDDVRVLLNELRKKPTEDPHKQNIPIINTKLKPKFKVGDVVYYISDTPLNALGKEQPTKKFRVGDRRWSIEPRKIVEIYYYSDPVPYRYGLEGKKNVSFTQYQLKLAKEQKQSKYIVRELIGKRKNKGRIEYLVWWKGYKKGDATYVPRTTLIEDNMKDYIKEYDDSIKA